MTQIEEAYEKLEPYIKEEYRENGSIPSEIEEILSSLIGGQHEPLVRSAFVDGYNLLAKTITEISESKGWKIDNDGEKIALMHSELSEALEAMRNGNPPDNHIPEFSGVEAELADTIIRIMHFGYRKGYRIADAVLAKVNYNRSRPYKHNGKRF